jgi:hypothetical protein
MSELPLYLPLKAIAIMLVSIQIRFSKNVFYSIILRSSAFVNVYSILIARHYQLKVCLNSKGESPVLALNKRLKDCG